MPNIDDNPPPQPKPGWKERVVAEKKELDEKIDKLKAFIGESPTFATLPGDEQGRLNRQFDVMVEYSGILRERIGAF